MFKILWNGRAGLNSNQNRLNVISNNISNVDTNGYKKADAAFEDIVYEKMDRLGLPVTSSERNKLQQGIGSKAEVIVRDFNQGIIAQTGKQSDLAIEGKGFFRIKDSEGNYYYSRDGCFTIDSQRNFVHSSGYLLDIEDYNPSELKDKFIIDAGGNIFSNDKKIGKINIFDFADRDGMVSYGQNLFQSNEEPMTLSGAIKQGCLEKSNVDISKELTDMLITQRAFELNSRTIRSADEMWQIANNLKSK